MEPGSGAGAFGFGHTGSCAFAFVVESRLPPATCVVSPLVRLGLFRAVSGHHAVLVGSPLAESCRAVSTRADVAGALAGVFLDCVSQASATASRTTDGRRREGIDELDACVDGVFRIER